MSERIWIDTPESVDLSLEPAGLGTRFLAALIDGLIMGGALFLLMMLSVGMGLFGAEMMGPGDLLGIGLLYAVLLLLFGLLFIAYKPFFEAIWNGQTPGKRWVGIRVVQANGLPVGIGSVIIRNLMRFVDVLPFYYMVGIISLLATRRNQRLGDLAAGTMVVYDRPAALPTVPVQLNHQPWCDLDRLREHVKRLNEADLAAARGYWARRSTMSNEVKLRIAPQVAQGLVQRMGWTEPLPPFPDDFIEEVLFVRAQ